jgi:signal transduction histidine kinase
MLSKYFPRLSISAKLLIMMGVMILVMLVMGNMVIQSDLKELRQLEKEQSGLSALNQHLVLLKEVNHWRRLISSEPSEADQQAEVVTALIAQIGKHPAYRDIGFDAALTTLPSQWHEVSLAETGLTAFMSASVFMEQLTQELLQIGERSQLVYDNTPSLALAIRILLNHIPSISDEYGKLHYLSRMVMLRQKTLAPEISAMNSALSIINKRMLWLTQLAMQQSVIRDPALIVAMMQLADQHSVFQFQVKSMLDQEFEEINAEKLRADFTRVTELEDQINQGLMAEIQLSLRKEMRLAQVSLVAIVAILLIMIFSVLWFYWRFIYQGIQQRLLALTLQVGNMQNTGRFHFKIDRNSSDEIGAVTEGLLNVFHQIDQAMSDVNQAFVAASRGDFKYRIRHVYRGDLQQLCICVNENLERLELQQKQALHAERIHTIGQMSASVAHEINNPVAGVMANLQYLQEVVDSRSPEKLQVLDECVTELNRVGKMVQGLLNFSRTDQCNEIVHTDIVPIIEQTFLLTREILLQYHVELICGYEQQHPIMAQIDVASFKQILMSLLVNAAQALGEVEHATISLNIDQHMDASRVYVSLTDNGAGIPKALQTKIFDPFFTTKSTGEGTGLGLALSVSMAQSFDAILYLDKDYNNGTRFVLNLAR